MMTFPRFLVSLCVLVVLAAAVPAHTYARQDAGAVSRAETAIKEGRYAEGLSILQPLISENTTNARLFVLRGQAYEGREEYRSAIADYQRALAIEPNNAAARAGLSRVQSRYDQSIRGDLESLRRLVEANPNNLQFRLQLADALYEAAQYPEAAEQYGAYLDRTQGTPDILRRYLIAIASYEGDNDKGEAVAERYLRFYPSDDDLHMRLGYFRLWQGKASQAIDAFEQALQLNPNNREAQQGLDQARNAQATQAATAGRQAPPANPAIDRLMADLRQNPNQDDKRYQLVDMLIDAGRFFEAGQQLDVLKPRHGDTAEWQRRRAIVDNRLKELAQSGQQAPRPFEIDRLTRELKQHPNQDEKRFQLVRELIKYNRYGEAYDQLIRLADKYDTTQRWLDLFVRVDDGFVKTKGTSPIYPIDRYTYRLRVNPNDATLRYQLVDALLAADRIAEARDVLAQTQYVDTSDPRYQTRLQAVEDAQKQYASRRIATLQAQLQQHPNDADALSELGSLYAQQGRTDDALALFDRLLQQSPNDTELRLAYTQMLIQSGLYEDALHQADELLARNPNNPEFQRVYAVAALSSGNTNARAEQYLASILDNNPDDVEVLLDLASLRLSQGQADEADRLLRRADALPKGPYEDRLESLSLLIERELIREKEGEQMKILNDARSLAASQRYQEAIQRYEDYFEARGKRTRAELKELAQVHSAAGDYVSALSILEALQAQMYEYDVGKEIAKNRYYARDYAGAIQVLEALLQENPNDFEVRMLLGDSYRELGRYAQARAVYEDLLESSPNSKLVEDRIASVEVGTVRGVSSGSGMNYAGLIVPVGEGTVAQGSGTEYTRWAQGIQTQVTLPISAVLTAGITTHYVSGTRRLIPNSEHVSERVNQVFGGGYIDLTPPIQSARASYTNRLSGLAGIFDYEGGRTVPFGEIRYWHQSPGEYHGSIGVRSTEGSIDLWSPAGGEFALRLTQIDIRAGTASILPDSLLRMSGTFAVNIITDNFGGIGSQTGANHGTSAQFDASYRMLPFTYLGVSYYQLSYETTVDIYYSPPNFQTYSAFLEYEREMRDRWYWRIRGSLGLVARSNGFVSRRLETDLVYRLARKLSITLSSSVGQSTRSFGNQPLTANDRYDTFIFTGALYWTL